MPIDDEATATMLLNMMAINLATQVIVACDKARVKVTARRIDDVLRATLPVGIGYDAMREMVEDRLAAFNAAVSELK